MTKQQVKDLTEIYFQELVPLLDMESIEEVDFGSYAAEKLKIDNFEIYQIKYKEGQGQLAVFLFVYLEEPDEIIAHKLMNFANEIAWFYSKKDEIAALPAIFPVLLYNGAEDWTPKSIKQIYTATDYMPEFHFEFIDLKQALSITV